MHFTWISSASGYLKAWNWKGLKNLIYLSLVFKKYLQWCAADIITIKSIWFIKWGQRDALLYYFDILKGKFKQLNSCLVMSLFHNLNIYLAALHCCAYDKRKTLGKQKNTAPLRYYKKPQSWIHMQHRT